MTTPEALPAHFDDSLLDLIKVNPILFGKEKRMKPYESMKESMDIWKSIALSLGEEPNFCIARWKILRERFRREIKEEKQDGHIKSSWALMEKMRLLNHHVHHSSSNQKIPDESRKSTVVAPPPPPKAEQIFGGTNYEDPLPEAMDAQTVPVLDTTNKSSPINFTIVNNTSNSSSILVRIKALLEGLGPHRGTAEKRILSYLCKCQIKTLENENIDNVEI